MWFDRAACVGADTSLFFPVTLNRRSGLAVCRKCPVRAECKKWADLLGCEYGIWGGEHRSPKQRQCVSCREYLPETMFTAGQNGVDGRRSYCRDCHRIKSQQYRQKVSA